MSNNLMREKIKYVALCLLLDDPLFAKVDPQPGENLWRLAARIGDCVDVADSKLDLLDSQQDAICSKIEELDDNLATHNDVVCSKLEVIASIVDSEENGTDVICSKLEDLDIDLSDHDASICSKLEQVDEKQDLLLSTIDELEFVGACEILIFQSDIPFTINSSGVYCLAESVSFATDTAITIAANNVLLDLQDKKIDGSVGGDIGIAINSGLENITIQNGTLCNMNDKGIDADATKNIAFISMSVSDSLIDSVVDMPAIIAPITCLQIKDIKVANVGIFKEFPIVSVIDSLVDSLIDSVIDTPDCLLSPITGININCVTEVVLNNCQVLCCLGDGFALSVVENGIIESCNAEKNGGNGFVLDNADTSCFKWCKANMNCFHGFCDSACNGDNFYLSCIAKQNGVHGFNIAGGGKVLQECIASQNTRDGFNLSTSLLKDGDLDATFGNDGKVITDFGGNDSGNAVALQKDGKIVVAGDSGLYPPCDFAVARYNTNGSLDFTFGIEGKVTTDLGGATDIGNAVALQKDGKIVVAGQSDAEGDNDFAIARYNTDGSLDLTFGMGGKVTTDFGGIDRGLAVTLQKDGKIVVAGFASNDFAVARYNMDGSLDLTFGTGGKVTTDFGGNDSGNAVVLQKDGKIVVAGTSGGDFAIARYNTDGSLDLTFGDNGTVTTDFGGNFDRGRAVALQKDGKTVVAGGAPSGFGIARYNTDGSLDLTFGMEGKVITDFGVGSEEGYGVALQKDGKVVVAGAVSDLSNFGVARYVVFKRGVAVRSCIAEENGEDGFNIAGSAYNVRDSAAIHNVADGFLLESLTDSCQLLSNEALQNNNIGIENLGIDNQIFNNRAHNNTEGNYVGVPLVTTPTLTTSFWANVEV